MDGIVYFGFNDPLRYKRGVENVISVQALAGNFKRRYYIFFDSKISVKRWNNVVVISLRKTVFRFLMLNFLIGRLSRHGSIFIHSHNYLCSFFLLRSTDIFTVHDGLYYLSKQFGKPKLLLWMNRIIERTVYRRSRVIHFVSNFSITQALLPSSARKKIKVIYNTTPLEQLSTFAPKTVSNRNGETSILVVRSIEERAYIDLVFEAAQVFRDRKDSVGFIIAGKGPLLEHFRELKGKKGLTNIVLKGFVPDEELIELYRNASLILVTARYGEGFGLPVIEGYLFNKPVIGSNLCAIPEIILDKSYLFENSKNSLVNAIDNVFKAPGRDNYHDYYMNNFAQRKIVERYNELYPQVNATAS
jgi:glycosyltransferase involved in cell wall biosynthesis